LRKKMDRATKLLGGVLLSFFFATAALGETTCPRCAPSGLADGLVADGVIDARGGVNLGRAQLRVTEAGDIEVTGNVRVSGTVHSNGQVVSGGGSGGDGSGGDGSGGASQPKHCAEIRANDPGAASGPASTQLGEVECDQTFAGGGWTVMGQISPDFAMSLVDESLFESSFGSRGTTASWWLPMQSLSASGTGEDVEVAIHTMDGTQPGAEFVRMRGMNLRCNLKTPYRNYDRKDTYRCPVPTNPMIRPEIFHNIGVGGVFFCFFFRFFLFFACVFFFGILLNHSEKHTSLGPYPAVSHLSRIHKIRCKSCW
jgi:hypothetical protein